MYKKLRDDITEANPVVYGNISSSFEVREKINAANGRGVIVAFSCSGGIFKYRTKNKTGNAIHIEGNASVTKNDDGTSSVEFNLYKSKTCIIFIE